MEELDSTQNNVSCEGNSELNGKDAVTRSAPMISESRVVMKRRIRGALVPMPRETL